MSSKQSMHAGDKFVRMSEEKEKALKASLRRMAEVSRLKAMLPLVKTPLKIGKRKLTKADKETFDLAVKVANREGCKDDNQAYGQAVVRATQEADSWFFEVVTAAMKEAKTARCEKSAASACAMLCLVAKLELEGETGNLPNTRDISERAYEIAEKWFPEDFYDKLPAPDERPAWSKARKAAGVNYVPEATS